MYIISRARQVPIIKSPWEISSNSSSCIHLIAIHVNFQDEDSNQFSINYLSVHKKFVVKLVSFNFVVSVLTSIRLRVFFNEFYESNVLHSFEASN